MESLPNGYTLELISGAFPLSTDSMVLSAFVRLPRSARVLDLGAGCATLGLLLCARNEYCTVTGIELDALAHSAAIENIRRNDLAGRMESICSDLRQLPNDFTGRFDCCVSNPPYFSGGPAASRTPLARREDCCAPAELFDAASKALKFGGDFFLVHKPERLAELIARGSEVNLEAKRLLLLRHRESGPITLICLQFRKGGKPGLTIEEACLFDPNNEPTAYYKSVYPITED
jgi:tRNA1(Val) A37 N6-methylase TrmN6